MYPSPLSRKLWRSAWQTLGLFTLLLGTASASQPAPDRSTAKFEVDFMTTMIDHHALAALMATTCERKAVHEDLRELCTDIRVSQTQEINLMQGGLRSWYGVRYSPHIKQDDRRRAERMAQLPPAKFEVEFMLSMNRHHSIAIQRAAVCLVRAHHNPLVDLCASIIQTQLDEIRIMQGWLCQWYGICHNHRHS